MPKLNRVSPIAGFKRVFGKEAFVQFAQELAKVHRLCRSLILRCSGRSAGGSDTAVQLDPAKMLDAGWALHAQAAGRRARHLCFCCRA